MPSLNSSNQQRVSHHDDINIFCVKHTDQLHLGETSFRYKKGIHSNSEKHTKNRIQHTFGSISGFMCQGGLIPQYWTGGISSIPSTWGSRVRQSCTCLLGNWLCNCQEELNIIVGQSDIQCLQLNLNEKLKYKIHMPFSTHFSYILPILMKLFPKKTQFRVKI